MAPALLLAGERARLADPRHVDRSWLQRDPAADVGLLRGAGSLKRLLFLFLLSESTGRLDPPPGSRMLGASIQMPELAPGSGLLFWLPGHGVCRSGSRSLGARHVAKRLAGDRIDRAGVRVSPLHSG